LLPLPPRDRAGMPVQDFGKRQLLKIKELFAMAADAAEGQFVG
jgi:hypothetical protein